MVSVPTPDDSALRVCLDLAAEESGLAAHYRDCVRPLLRTPETRWPRCCGGGCEPCAETLKRVAKRTLELLEEGETQGGDASSDLRRSDR